MSPHSIMYRVVRTIFELDRPVYWILKPLVFVMLVNAIDLLVKYLIVGVTADEVPMLLIITTIGALPFMVFGFGAASVMVKAQDQLSHLARTDHLTGLLNRRAFMEAMKRAFVMGKSGYIMVIDADSFKQINDIHGHAVGDICLVAIADRFRSVLSDDDALGRIGGEEFAIFLADKSPEDVALIGDELTAPIHVPLTGRKEGVTLTMSVGVAWTDPLEPVETTMQRADIALYQAKTDGRARMIVSADRNYETAA